MRTSAVSTSAGQGCPASEPATRRRHTGCAKGGGYEVCAACQRDISGPSEASDRSHAASKAVNQPSRGGHVLCKQLKPAVGHIANSQLRQQIAGSGCTVSCRLLGEYLPTARIVLAVRSCASPQSGTVPTTASSCSGQLCSALMCEARKQQAAELVRCRPVSLWCL